MRSKLINAVNFKELEIKIRQEINEDFQPSIGFGFCNHHADIKGLSHFFAELRIDLIGCTTAGEVADDEVQETSMVVLLLTIPSSDYLLISQSFGPHDEQQVASDISNRAAQLYKNPGIVFFSSGVARDGVKIVNGIKSFLSPETQIFGGLAGDLGAFKDTYCFSHKNVYPDGLVALILDTDKIEIKGQAVSGWKGLGLKNTITKADGNVVHEINGVAALDYFTNHFGLNVFDDPTQEDIPSIPGQFPLEMINDKGEQQLRSILTADTATKSLILAGGVEEGQQFRFCTSPSIEVIDKSVKEYQLLAKDTQEADAVILVSCMARKVVFGPLIENEIMGINALWNAPLIGFFSYGEIGKIGGTTHCDFHNCTSNIFTLTQIKK